MPGETNLGVLLRSMRPVLREGEFVFLTTRRSLLEVAPLEPLGLFHEEEGLTLILSREKAEAAGLPYTAVFRMVTLSVHSSLEAVGFLAAITNRLAARGISVNPVSAYFHDHLFVPSARAEESLALLLELARGDASPG
ncbi:ACT domain-containing protein [Archangium violaceum]|uniref:ACT domain-containing protein n=1 Tax=Archangium violaceum TaxID=83451 RepID=UPI00193C73F1|nr:ACT domain-containing protein [Archangium violaceum]QRK12664.1 ACT domain-containing protein [Archangium violaceum]